jgi:ribokinase
MPRFEVAVLHDYYVDRLVLIQEFDRLSEAISKKADEGGGGIHGVRQLEIRGGNAANLAYALGRLRTRTFLLTHSDPAHEPLLRAGFKGLPVVLRVKKREAGLTVAIEGTTGGVRTNVMLGHNGGAGEFPPSVIDGDDWSALKESKIVCSVNWAANSHGTELLIALRKHLGRKHQIFLDPADMRDRLEPYGELLRIMRERNLVNWLSLNEAEARATGSLLGIREKDLGDLSRSIARKLSLRVDVHTKSGSYTSTGSEVVRCGIGWVTPKRLTGAGDVWDAASIHFFLRGKSDADRLALANAAAKYYVSAEEPEAPTRREVLRLMKP